MVYLYCGVWGDHSILHMCSRTCIMEQHAPIMLVHITSYAVHGNLVTELVAATVFELPSRAIMLVLLKSCGNGTQTLIDFRLAHIECWQETNHIRSRGNCQNIAPVQ